MISRTNTILLVSVIISFIACRQDTKSPSLNRNNISISNDTFTNELINTGESNVIQEYKEISEEEIINVVSDKVEEAKNTDSLSRMKSKIAHLTCNDILIKYEKAIQLLESDIKSKEGRKLYKELRNDPVFSDCRSELDVAFGKLDKRYINIGK